MCPLPREARSFGYWMPILDYKKPNNNLISIREKHFHGVGMTIAQKETRVGSGNGINLCFVHRVG